MAQLKDFQRIILANCEESELITHIKEIRARRRAQPKIVAKIAKEATATKVAKKKELAIPVLTAEQIAQFKHAIGVR